MPREKVEIQEILQNIFREVFDNDSLGIYDAMTAADIEDWDSLTHMLLISAIEKTFEFRFSAAEVFSLKNVGEMVDLIKRKKG